MQPQGALSFTELVLNASFLVQCVMLFLLALSVVSWTIIISRNNQYRIGRVKADEFEDRFWSGIDLNNLYQECMKRPNELVGLEVIYSAGFKEFVRLVNSGPADQDVVMDGTYRQMKVACSREVELLESHLPTLATIGSISPYIGLFGTVWGIMHAFVSLAAVKNATLAMVAPPIAEALIATAMGLFAAIPAVMFYNRFVTKVEALENRYYNFMDEFSTILNRRLVTIRTQLNRGGNGANPNNNAAMQQQMQFQQQQQQQQQQQYFQQQQMQQQQQAAMGSKEMHSGMMPPSGSIDNVQVNFSEQEQTAQSTAQAAATAAKFGTARANVDMNSSQAQDFAKAMHPNLGAAANSASGGAVGMSGGATSRSSVGVIPHGVSVGAVGSSMSTHGATGAASAASNQAATNRGLNARERFSLGASANKGRGGANQNAATAAAAAASAPQVDPNLAANYRGVVPPRNASANFNNAQLPGGAASAVKPSMSAVPPMGNIGPIGSATSAPMASAPQQQHPHPQQPQQMQAQSQAQAAHNAPIYKAGVDFDRRPRPAPSDDEPLYITPGGQNQRRMGNQGQ